MDGQPAPSSPRPNRRLRVALIALAGAVLALLLVLGAFPWGALKPVIERRLGESIGQPVRIGSLSRGGFFSYHPVLIASDIRVQQPDWAGEGDMAKVRELRLKLSAWRLLIGDTAPEAVTLKGARIALVRDAQGRKSWQAEQRRGSGGGTPRIRQLEIADTILLYRDEKRRRSAQLRVTADERAGLRVAGEGQVMRTPVTITAQGAALSGEKAEQRWPFRLDITGPAVALRMEGTMDRALDTSHFTARATARGRDLALLDALIEAGLPATQPVQVVAQVTRDAPDWKVTGLKGRIGRSDIAGDATIRKRAGRTRIDGAIRSQRFDFADLASNAGKARAAAKRAQTGERVIPDTAIDLATVDKTDGRLELSVRELLWPGSAPFRYLTTTLVLERSLMKLQPLSLGLTHGRMEGWIRIDQRRGGPVLRTDLTLRGGRLLDFFPDPAIDATLTGRVRLTGTGKTVRSAVGRSNGVVALVARNGVIPARTAALLGQDIGRGFTLGKDRQAELRCLVARMEVRGGIAIANPVVIDTSQAQTRATGRIRLSDERMALMLSGAPKHGSLLRLPGAVPVAGTIKAPDIQVPQSARSVGGVLKMLGRAITGKQGDLATDADCSGLAARAMR